MYFFLVSLFILSVGYILKVRSSRLCKIVLELPANSRELPIVGSGFEFLGTSEVFTNASDAAEVLKTYLDKDYLYSFLQTITGNGSAFGPTSIAKAHRQVMLPAFSARTLNNFVDVFWSKSIRLVDQLEALAGTGPVPLERYLNEYAFETIIKTGMGVNDGFCTKDFLNSFNESLRLVNDRMRSLWYHPDFMYKWSPQYADVQRCVKTLYHNADQIITMRRNELKKYKELKEGTVPIYKECLFDALLTSKLSDENIREEVLVLILGTDLTSLSMGYTLMLLAQYPAVQDKVYEERVVIQFNCTNRHNYLFYGDTFGADRHRILWNFPAGAWGHNGSMLQDVFGDSDRPVVKDDLIKLNYLDMVIKESLRLYPPAPLIARKAFKEVTLSSGVTVPAGAGIVVSIIGLHRNPKYWGPDAEHFDPERFLPERFQKVAPNAYMPFSFGPRNCIGYKYGQMTMKVALSTILRKYKIVGEPAEGPVPSIRTKFEIFMKSVNQFEVELVKRN